MDESICPRCEKRKRKKRRYSTGRVVLYPSCGPCQQNPETLRAQRQRQYQAAKAKGRERGKWHPYRNFKKDHCENPECTATIVDSCQLDVDHIDGNHKNNDPSNLMTLCANCHRLKTKVCGDGPYRPPLDVSAEA